MGFCLHAFWKRRGCRAREQTDGCPGCGGASKGAGGRSWGLELLSQFIQPSPKEGECYRILSSPGTDTEPSSPLPPLSSVLSPLWCPFSSHPLSTLFAPLTELSSVRGMAVGFMTPDWQTARSRSLLLQLGKGEVDFAGYG